jgi:hypothetical protein
MSFTDAQLNKFQKTFKNCFGVELSSAEACEKLESLVREVEITYKPMTEKEFEQLQQRRLEMKLI